MCSNGRLKDIKIDDEMDNLLAGTERIPAVENVRAKHEELL
jgi:hypothetical protein